MSILLSLLPLSLAGSFTCSDDCDAGGSGDVCTEDLVGSDYYWVCDTKIPGDTSAASTTYENGDDAGTLWMATYGTAGNGSAFCCYTEQEVVKVLLWGTSNADTLEVHDGTANHSFRMNHGTCPGGGCEVNVWGRDGNDTIETADDHSPDIYWDVYGGDGDDTLYARNSTASVDSQVEMWGGNHGDTLYGSAGHDTLFGGAGDDYIYGDAGEDAIKGGAGVDRLFGEDDDDHLWGDDGADYLMGGGSDDILRGGAGDDAICGEAGTDDMFGESGDDILYDPESDSEGHGGPASDNDSCDGTGNYANCDDNSVSSSPCPAP